MNKVDYNFRCYGEYVYFFGVYIEFVSGLVNKLLCVRCSCVVRRKKIK